MIIVPDTVSDATLARLRSLEERGCTKILVTAIGETGLLESGGDLQSGAAYWMARLTLPSGVNLREDDLDPEVAASALIRVAEAGIA